MQNKEGTVNGGGITDRQIEQRERHQPERRAEGHHLPQSVQSVGGKSINDQLLVRGHTLHSLNVQHCTVLSSKQSQSVCVCVQCNNANVPKWKEHTQKQAEPGKVIIERKNESMSQWQECSAHLSGDWPDNDEKRRPGWNRQKTLYASQIADLLRRTAAKV